MITVREGLTPALQAAVAGLMATVYPSRFVHLPRKALEDAAARIALESRFFGLYDGDRPIGYYSFRLDGRNAPGGQFHILVDPAYHGRWMTRGIRQHILDLLFAHQDVAVVSARGAGAWRFTERFGFTLKEDRGETRVYEMRKDDALPYRSTHRPRAA